MLLGGEGPALDVRAQVVGPPQPAALAAPVQPWNCNASSARGRSRKSVKKRRVHACTKRAGSISIDRGADRARTRELGEHAPVAGSVGLDVVDEQLVLLGRPWPLLDALAVAARSPPHGRWSVDLRFPSPAASAATATRKCRGRAVLINAERRIYRPRRIPVAINATDFHLLGCGCCCNATTTGKGKRRPSGHGINYEADRRGSRAMHAFNRGEVLSCKYAGRGQGALNAVGDDRLSVVASRTTAFLPRKLSRSHLPKNRPKRVLLQFIHQITNSIFNHTFQQRLFGFRCKMFLDFVTVAHSFVYGKYCSIIA